jgi:chromosome segregation ATPase
MIMRTTLELTTLGALAVSIGLGACTKSPQEKEAEARRDAAEDVAETRREASEEVRDIRKEEAEEVGEAREEAAEGGSNVGAAATRTDTRETFQKNIEARVDKLDDAIDDLESKVKDKPETAKTALNPVITDAKAKVEAAKTKLEGFKDTKEDTWTTMRPEVEQSLTAAETAVEMARRQLAAH